MRLKNIPRFSSFAVLVLASAANASFCRLFGGDWAAIGIVFAATFCGFFVKQRLSSWKMDYRAVTIISAVTAAVISCVGYVIPDLFHHARHSPLGTSVLYLVPGSAVLQLRQRFALRALHLRFQPFRAGHDDHRESFDRVGAGFVDAQHPHALTRFGFCPAFLPFTPQR